MEKKHITIIGVVAILAITGLVFFNAEVSEQVSEVAQTATEIKVKMIPSTFDCANAIDELVSYYESVKEDGQQTSNPMKEAQEMYQTIQSASKQLVENRCWITIESWAHESENESLLWSMPWQESSWQSQVILGEVQCDTKQCDDIRETYKQNIEGLK